MAKQTSSAAIATKKTEKEPHSQTLFSQGVLPSISRELYAAAAHPSGGDAPFVLPCDLIGQALGQAFSLTSVSIRQIEPGSWTEAPEAAKIVQDSSCDLLEIGVSGIDSPLYISIPTSAYTNLAEILLQRPHATDILSNSDFSSAFHTFALFQTVGALRSIPAMAQLGISLKKCVEPHEKALIEPSVSLSVRYALYANEINMGEVRTVLPASFLDAWEPLQRPSFEKSLALFRSTLSVPVSLELGRTIVQACDLAAIRSGDILLIDHPFYRPESGSAPEKNRVILTVLGSPIFKGKFEQNGLKILELPMVPEIFYSQAGALEPPNTRAEADAAMNIQEVSDMAKSKASASNPEADLEKEAIDIEQNPFEGEDPLDQEPESPQAMEDASLAAQSKSYLPPEKIDVASLSHTVVVRLAQLQMSLEELSKLAPGNIIDLAVSPQDPVSVLVQGKVIALGDLVVIGDHIGVRLRDIGQLS